ncbi:undecaprenyldiphospho-muramoylpentapeptide beta-N-acetylglucosaminyltransferase [Candidatus Protochlamydia amoebophila]|uniref:UDP-N-acetylglucosamine--N-acetylmuramyl-(Pentapeptide) pyrophosphoryl-undecaprenol N-acetylglucosamine transferase n=1 Tax=Candidatus Protochlamydia amoebophila TaxID=362787 RepID=A0A0C1JIV5_9BACT|nr:undecaprenyldiphospho-muramoylpentapeptide beta-N-acetylglucosaminyltransferase [Candidatus Protochlamydia amoebophila]KIC71315.1 UDP-N-acetylglucosamine--N-acetylmuramyl- (pentapeptide) pyrophosphoryl-undecaprenol N-acetylglucosamine transferase [Candidatus Protochlamydia amoebophila]
MSKRFMITAGGTGGHIFPAQGLAQELIKKTFSSSILFVAGGLSTNKYFDRSIFPFQEISASPLFSKNPFKLLKGVFNLLRGVWQSIRIIRKFKPDVVVGFGSYYTVPPLLAAKILRIPIVLHEANSIPGKANKWLASMAWRVGIHFPFTATLLKGNTIEVGMPLREGYQLDQIDKIEALSYFGLSKNNSTLLVFGGSQGALAINRLMRNLANTWKNTPIQIIHITGSIQEADDLKIFYANYQVKASVKAFEKNMHLAWRAAEVFIGRSGASTIAEAMEFEVPGILIPYPHATDHHQDKNADFLLILLRVE